MPSAVFTYIFGICAALIFGPGMCLCMKVIGNGTVMVVLEIVAIINHWLKMDVKNPTKKQLK